MHAFIEDRRSNNARPATVTWYRAILDRFAQSHQAYPLDRRAWTAWQAGHPCAACGHRIPAEARRCPACGGSDRIPLSDERRHGYYRALRAFARWVAASQALPNPMSGRQAPRVRRALPRYLDADQLRHALHVQPTRRDRALIALLISSKARIGEIAGLTWDHIGPGELRVTGKTGPRIIPLGPETRQELLGLGDGHHLWTRQARTGPGSRCRTCGRRRRQHMIAIPGPVRSAGACPPPAGPVRSAGACPPPVPCTCGDFLPLPQGRPGPQATCAGCGHRRHCHSQGAACTTGSLKIGRPRRPDTCEDFVPISQGTPSPLSYWGVHGAVRRALARAGIRGPKAQGAHILRHSGAREFLRAGGDIRDLRVALGHAKLTTTLIYAELADDAQAQRIRQFDPVPGLLRASATLWDQHPIPITAAAGNRKDSS